MYYLIAWTPKPPKLAKVHKAMWHLDMSVFHDLAEAQKYAEQVHQVNNRLTVILPIASL